LIWKKKKQLITINKTKIHSNYLKKSQRHICCHGELLRRLQHQATKKSLARGDLVFTGSVFGCFGVKQAVSFLHKLRHSTDLNLFAPF
jgi:hypothetical protein